MNDMQVSPVENIVIVNEVSIVGKCSSASQNFDISGKNESETAAEHTVCLLTC